MTPKFGTQYTFNRNICDNYQPSYLEQSLACDVYKSYSYLGDGYREL